MDPTSALAATAAASAVLSPTFPIRSTPRNLQQPGFCSVLNLSCKHSYANQFAPKDWLPEIYFGKLAGSVGDYREMIRTLATWKGLPDNIRLYAKHLNDYFKSELGELLLENLYMSAVVLSKHTVHQQSGAAVIYSQSSSLLGEKRRRSDNDTEVSARNQPRPHPHAQQESNNESSPSPSPSPQTPPRHEDLGSDSDTDDGSSLLGEDDFVEIDDTSSFQLSSENRKVYDKACEWFENKIQRKIEDTIKGLRTDRFSIPWIHDLLYDRLKLLRSGLDPTTDENTYTSYWIAPDFFALQTGIDELISKGFINENHFWPSALRRRLARGVENAKGTSVDGYWYAMDGKVDVIFENMGSPECRDYRKRDALKIKSERNSVDALLHRFRRNGPMEIAKDYQVIFVLVCGEDLMIYTTSIMDGRKYCVRKIFQEKYEFSANQQASALVHLHFCLVIKTIMEANQNVSFRFDKATAKNPTGLQTKDLLQMHYSPKKV
ncbi:hypothetical protein BGZ95_000558 [Linnemannia exigua]|uniref:Uncharacterized protein n=1 Tax=Linnemannia exigua TaxID=604196 RepID=A0AAD4DJD2_9FUNG|nr:hypothetical protein BGZ95_000558 [Linnemannia exigua]